MRASHGRGIVLLCSRAGVVERTLQDDLELGEAVKPGIHLADLVDPGSADKARGFLAAVDEVAAIDWEMNVAVDGRLTTLHFAGGRLGEQLLVVALPERAPLADVFAELMRLNNDQATALRAALKQGQRRGPAGDVADARVYDEITGVNNNLAALQREVAKKNGQLERLVEQQNQFLGMAAHDLRSPLSAIVAFSQFLEAEAGARLDEEQREFLATIRQSSDFMLHLIDDLLDISKIEAGQLDLERTRVELREFVRRNARRQRAVAAKKRVAIGCVDGAAPVIADVDPHRLEQVLDNLVSNAVKFSHPDSQVWIEVAGEGDQAVIAVRDEGVGLEPEQIAGLFTPYQKGGTRGTGGEASTGLGLAIVKRIVTAHGGRIEVDSEVGRGTTFSVHLPALVEAEA